MFFKIFYLIILGSFLLAFIYNFVQSLIRDKKAKKALKENPIAVKTTVKDVQQVKGRVYISVDFNSSHNRLLFSETFELYEGDIKLEDYPIGKEVEIYHNDMEGVEKVRNFPVQLQGTKVKLEKGLLFLNSALIFLGAFVFGNTLFMYIQANAFTNDIPLVGENGLYSNYFYMLLMFVIYFILTNYLVASIVDTPKSELQNYLKFYGNVAKARVITYKFGRNKNARGVKESIITLEFSTNKGEKVETKLTSFLYTETQEEYIDILYDPKNPKTVVYLRQ